jgi:hypothetical protein
MTFFMKIFRNIPFFNRLTIQVHLDDFLFLTRRRNFEGVHRFFDFMNCSEIVKRSNDFHRFQESIYQLFYPISHRLLPTNTYFK